MSAAMFKQMMEEATAFLKEAKYEKALDVARRVSQFNASNFPALMCVGVASFHLQMWEDAETALRRAADLKPDLPAPWKNLVDLYDATNDGVKKIEVLEKLIGVFRSGNKVKPSQKWISELASTAMSLKLYGKAFDAWYTLVDEKQGLSVDAEANDELPSSLAIWLNLLDLVQLPAFSLSDAKSSNVSMDTLMNQFVAVAQRWNWTDKSTKNEALCGKTDIALAMFFRYQLDQLKAAKSIKAKQIELNKLDVLTSSLIEWFPASKLAAEYLLLRSEDNDSPIDETKAIATAAQLGESFPKSPMHLMFQGFSMLESEPMKAHEMLIEGLASCSASSFHEGSLCVRAQMELACLALSARDVEGCLARLKKAQELVVDKTQLLGCAPPKAAVYSDTKILLLRAQAQDLAGAFDEALEAYAGVISVARSCGDAERLSSASVGVGELLCSKGRASEALELIEGAVSDSHIEAKHLASLRCSLAWTKYLLGDIETAKILFEENQAQLSSAVERARSLKRLAIVYWHMDGTFRTDKKLCLNSLLQAARLSPSDGEVFAWLGRWYKYVRNDVSRAEKCFVKSLALMPLNEMAGEALSEIYQQQGKTELNVKLWQDLTASPESAPTWALLRLAQNLVDHDDEDAVSKLHLVLRNQPLNTTYWVAMGHVYRHFGKLVAAQRSYLRAIELGESGWCVLTELARIEGSLHLFDDAIERIQQASVDSLSAPQDVVRAVHAELLFEQAKYFNGEGLYGRAAANIKKAADLLKPIATSGSVVPVLKLLGDVHSFAFYLSPLDFTDEGWINFLSQGREAYERIVPEHAEEPSHVLAQAHYDVGASCWYQARALYSIRGQRFNAFTLQNGSTAIEESANCLEDARKHLHKALEYDPSFALAWNALGVVVKHPIAKQLAWTRAIQASNIDAAWANLGMLYLHHRSDDSRTADLARNAFLHLQAVNTNNPAMWIGYGMLYLSQKNRSEHRKALEAFQCALEMGNHLDALQGVVLASSIARRDAVNEEMPSLEFVQFAIKKYLEREPMDPLAWALLSITQVQLGDLRHAVMSSTKSQEFSDDESNDAVANNVAMISAAKLLIDEGYCKQAFTTLIEAFSGTSAGRFVLDAQRLYSTGDKVGALHTSQETLRSAATNSCEQSAVIGFSLALCALSIQTHRKESLELAELALAAVGERVVSGMVTIQELEAAEAFHQAADSLPEFLSLLSAFQGSRVQGVADYVTTHRGLVCLDLLDPGAFTPVKQSSVTVGDDFSALKSLLTTSSSVESGETSSSPTKLVRAEPWNPAAYAFAALGMYKNAVLDESAVENKCLSAALHLLDSGLQVAEDQPALQPLTSVLLHWTCAVVHQRLGSDESTVKMHSNKALEKIRASEVSVIDKLLWEARIHALVDRGMAIEKYTAGLKQTGAMTNSNLVLAVLYELGGLCESSGLLDAAHHVWKTVMSWKSIEGDTEAFNMTGFLGNLHLAIVHATKQNTKSAKKFSKTAVALATVGDEGSDGSMMLTTARLVESVIAKM